jgi:hypothetical protein
MSSGIALSPAGGGYRFYQRLLLSQKQVFQIEL